MLSPARQVNAVIPAPDIYNMLVAVGEAKIQSSYFKVRALPVALHAYAASGIRAFPFCASSRH